MAGDNQRSYIDSLGGLITLVGAVVTLTAFCATLQFSQFQANAEIARLREQIKEMNAAARGPKGDRGLQGIAGPVGPSGPVGPKGDTGLKGDRGDDPNNPRLDAIVQRMVLLERKAFELVEFRTSQEKIQQPVADDVRDRLKKFGFSGKVTGSYVSQIQVTNVSFGNYGEFTADIDWPSWKYKNRIRGVFRPGQFSFQEIAPLGTNSKYLGCEYELNQQDNYHYSGIMRGCDANPPGTIEVILPQ